MQGSPSYFISVVIFISLNNCYNLNFCHAKNVTMQMLEDFGSKSNTTVNGQVSETQHATCRITTEELVANAEATVTRVLTGMCNSDMVNERFTNLEQMLKQEFDGIKRTLNALLVQSSNTRQFHTNHEDGSFVDNFIIDPRQEEIDRFNSTIRELHTSSGTISVFAYYFRIDGFNVKIENWQSGKSIRSSTFYVSPMSYAMYLKVTPMYSVHSQMTYVNFGTGVTRGRYDETLEWPFPLKQQVEILDHSAGELHRRQDLTSRISIPSNSSSSESWRRPSSNQGNADNREWVGLNVPTSVLLQSRSSYSSSLHLPAPKYLWRGSLTFKLTIFL